MEEVAGVVWGDIAAVARETTREPLAAPPLGLNCRALGSGGQNEMSYSCTSKCVLFEISLAVVCWLLRVQLVQNLRQPRGNSARGRARHRCYSRADGGQPFSRFTLASSYPRRSTQGAWREVTVKLLYNCRREKPSIGISPSGAVASKDANNQLLDGGNSATADIKTRLISCRLAVVACNNGSIAKMSRGPA
jgi:hypothetical protein